VMAFAVAMLSARQRATVFQFPAMTKP